MTSSTSDLSGPQGTRRAILGRARAAGFDAVGIADPDAIADAGGRLESFIERGFHGDMTWMADRVRERARPAALWPEVRSIVVAGLNYGDEGDPLALLDRKDRGNVALYARGRDYHDIFKKRLKALARWIAEEMRCEVKVFVDTAPVMEKPLAEAAGIGWQGKHTNLVSRDFGSWLFLGAIFTTLDLAADKGHADRCGHCSACLDICPTDAFPAPYLLDARRCISYLTIEHKGHIKEEFRRAIGNRIFGCDDCLAVCPWNKFARRAGEARFLARDELRAPRLAEFLELDDGAFRRFFSGSPVKRSGRDRFIRNVLIAAGNSGDRRLIDPVQRLLKDPSPLVRAMAVWACGQLADDKEFAALRQQCSPDPDPEVEKEWRR